MQLLLLAALTEFDLARFVLGLCGLDEEEVASGFPVDPPHHVFEQREGFFFELDEGIFLAIAAQADAFLEVVEA